MASGSQRILQADGVDTSRLRSGFNNSQMKHDYYNTLATPLTKNEHYSFPWPVIWLLQSAGLHKLKRLLKGEILSTLLCIFAIVLSFASTEMIQILILMVKTITRVLLPPILAANVFFWSARFCGGRQLTCPLGHIFLFCAIQELYCEVFVFLREENRYLLGLIIFPSVYFYIVSAHCGHELATLGIISTFSLMRFGIYGLLSTYFASVRYMHLVTYAASIIGLHLGKISSETWKKTNHLSEGMDAKFSVIRRRRGSSVDSTLSNQSSFSVTARQRRTSLPVLGLPSRRVSMSSMDLTTLGEAHGMITDMLADPSLPPYVIGTLRVIGDMISPLLQHGFQRAPFSSPLVTVMEKSTSNVQDDEAKVIDQPDLKDDTPLSLKQRLSRQLGVNVRRMSSSYTTTTSATGMPTLDHEYRSRNASHNVPDGVSSRSPSPKVSQRAKSYAGVYPSVENRWDYIKSRSFCQQASPLVRQEGDTVFTGSDGIEVGDGTFKAEVACGTESFLEASEASRYYNESRESLDFNQTDNENDGNSDNESPLRSDRRGSYEVRFSDEFSQDCNEKEVKFEVNKTEENKTNDQDFQSDLRNNELSNSLTNLSSKVSPLAQRRTENLTVAQVVPVRKNSRDETANRRLSRDSYLSVPRRGSGVGLLSRLSSKDIQHELEISCQENVSGILNRIYDWEFPVFDLSDKCNVLTQLALRIFQVSGFFRKFDIPQDAFINYFRNLEEGYHNIPYHNKIHAADVLHGVYYLTNQKIPGFNGPADINTTKLDNAAQEQLKFTYDDDSFYGCLSSLIPELELMALYTAAAMHDFDHPGKTNAFLVATLNPKALLYNDRSVLENHHAAASWSLLVSDPSNNFLTGLDALEFKRFRFIVIEEILSTDLKKHFDFLSEWNAKTSDQSAGINCAVEADRLLVGQMCMKLADISGPSKNWDLHLRWTERIVEEFYLQGDEELSRGMPISPYMDRNQPRVAHLQESFIKHLVGPLYNAYCRAGLLPGEWIEADVEDDEDDDTENGAMPTMGTDSNSDRSDNEDEIALKVDRESPKSKMKKKVPSYPIIINLDSNHETWQEKIRQEQEAAKKAEGTEEDAAEANLSNHHHTIAEEEDDEANADGK